MSKKSDILGIPNAWSLLYDEIVKMDRNDENQDHYFSDLLDHTYINNMQNSSNSSPFKYNEDEIVKELLEYIRSTYQQHYAANDQNLQTLDFIEAAHNDGESCCRDNIMKYVSRYDKKGTARRDITKIMHYAVLLMHFNDKNAKLEIYPQ